MPLSGAIHIRNGSWLRADGAQDGGDTATMAIPSDQLIEQFEMVISRMARKHDGGLAGKSETQG